MHMNVQFFMSGKTYVANPADFAIHASWIIGHLIDYVLLGIALLRAQVSSR
jgi:hypothetical protein